MEGFDFILKLNESIRQRLLDQAEFGQPPAVPVLTEDRSDFAKEIEKNLMQKLGFCVVVATPEVYAGSTPNEEVLKIIVNLSENPVLNQSASGSRIRCNEGALRAKYALLHWTPPQTEWVEFSPMEPFGDSPVMVLAQAPNQQNPILSYQIILMVRVVIEVEDDSKPALSGTP